MIFIIGVLSIVSTILFLTGILTAVLGMGAAGSSKPGVGIVLVILGILLVAGSF